MEQVSIKRVQLLGTGVLRKPGLHYVLVRAAVAFSRGEKHKHVFKKQQKFLLVLGLPLLLSTNHQQV